MCETRFHKPLLGTLYYYTVESVVQAKTLGLDSIVCNPSAVLRVGAYSRAACKHKCERSKSPYLLRVKVIAHVLHSAAVQLLGSSFWSCLRLFALALCPCCWRLQDKLPRCLQLLLEMPATLVCAEVREEVKAM